MKQNAYILASAVGLAFLSVGCGTNIGSVQARSPGTVRAVAQQTQTLKPAAIAGHPAPDFQLPSLTGEAKNLSLQELTKNGPVLLNAWASWCPPCQEETPALVKLSELYKGRIQVIGVNMTTADELSSAKKFVTKRHVSYTVLYDPKGVFQRAYAAFALPESILVSRQGTVLAVHRGGLTLQQFEQFVQPALNRT